MMGPHGNLINGGDYVVNWNEVKSVILEVTALVFVNILALYFDAEYIPMAIGVDCLVLGVEVKTRLTG